MHEEAIRSLLKKLQAGQTDIDSAMLQLKNLPYEDLGFAMLDHHRQMRTGCPETIFSEGKSIDQIVSIASRLLEKNNNVMATRANRDVYHALKTLNKPIDYHETARIVVIKTREIPKTRSTILVMSAGTSDIPVAEEAAVTAETLGNSVQRVFDVGVAGIHRLFSQKEKIDQATVLIVVAGMDGALPSVVAGLTDKPVIAVPTSVGYGASFGGIAALLTMLNSCANGVTVVNIDNGYGAGYSASAINHLAEKVLTNNGR